MNQDWQNFLTTQGAQLQDGVVQDFGDAAAERAAARDATVLCDLSQFGVLKVHGEEAQGFLHNLFSSDVNALTPQKAEYSSFNTAKGRALATFLIWRSGTEFFLQLPQSLIAPMQKKLSMYVLRAKVKIEDASDGIVCLGLSGANAATLLQQHFPALPQAGGQALQIIARAGERLVLRRDPVDIVVRGGVARAQGHQGGKREPRGDRCSHGGLLAVVQVPRIFSVCRMISVAVALS